MVSEFEFIDNIKSKYGVDKVGDDCAILPKDTETNLLMTADLLIEDIDFRLEWTMPELLGHKALAVSLSDIAAMGGSPDWAMLSIGVPEKLWNSGFVERFYEGWFLLANEYGVELVGGDISRSPDRLVIDSVVGGYVATGKALLRSTAHPGDALFISGTLGAAAGGLKLLEKGFRYGRPEEDHTSSLLLRQLKPTPQVSVGNLLQLNGIGTSCIDVSDGLSSDLEHICRYSGVGARIYSDRLPIDPDLAHHFPTDECEDMALNGGEDLGLLFTVKREDLFLIRELPVTQIGDMIDAAGTIEIVRNGIATDLKAKGYTHF